MALCKKQAKTGNWANGVRRQFFCPYDCESDDGRLWQLAKQCYALAKDTLLPEAQRALQDIGAKYEQQADELRRIAIAQAEYPKDKKNSIGLPSVGFWPALNPSGMIQKYAAVRWT